MTEEERIIKTLLSDIKFELEKLLSLKDDMEELKSNFGDKKPDKFDCSAAGYLLHNFYNGAENIFKDIASVFGNRVDKEEWHSTLLKRMLLEIEDVRPKVISIDLYKKLLDYKNFRHFFRHAYLFELDWGKMKGLVDDFEKTIEKLDMEMGKFIKEIRDIMKQKEST
ncbi:MAG: antitoxin [Candidatus Aminicenantes bacterium]|nr:MAG: antitoxin [Candidatus Aminicenantes bacterium]